MKSFAVLLISLFITIGFAQAQTQPRPSDGKETKSEVSQGHKCDGNHQHGSAAITTETKTCNKPCTKPCDKPCDKAKAQSSEKPQSKNKSKAKKAGCCQQHSQQKTSK